MNEASETPIIPIDGHEPSPPPADETPKTKVQRWALHTVDVDYPPDGVGHFDAGLREPALFQKAYAFKAQGRISAPDGSDAGASKMQLRLVFLVCPDAPVVSHRFMAMSPGHAIGVPEDMPSPDFLDVVVSPYDGLPLGIWYVPPVEMPPELEVEPPTDAQS